MKPRCLLLLIMTLCTGLTSLAQSPNALHTPPPNSAERKAIMDALRDQYFKDNNQKVVFKVNFLKVHQGWAWVDTTPLDDKGKPVAEGGPTLLHYSQGAWAIMDLSGIPDDPDNPMGPMDPDPRYIKRLQKKYPGVPADIFPPRHK